MRLFPLLLHAVIIGGIYFLQKSMLPLVVTGAALPLCSTEITYKI